MLLLSKGKLFILLCLVLAVSACSSSGEAQKNGDSDGPLSLDSEGLKISFDGVTVSQDPQVVRSEGGLTIFFSSVDANFISATFMLNLDTYNGPGTYKLKGVDNMVTLVYVTPNQNEVEGALTCLAQPASESPTGVDAEVTVVVDADSSILKGTITGTLNCSEGESEEDFGFTRSIDISGIFAIGEEPSDGEYVEQDSDKEFTAFALPAYEEATSLDGSLSGVWVAEAQASVDGEESEEGVYTGTWRNQVIYYIFDDGEELQIYSDNEPDFITHDGNNIKLSVDSMVMDLDRESNTRLVGSFYFDSEVDGVTVYPSSSLTWIKIAEGPASVEDLLLNKYSLGSFSLIENNRKLAETPFSYIKRSLFEGVVVKDGVSVVDRGYSLHVYTDSIGSYIEAYSSNNHKDDNVSYELGVSNDTSFFGGGDGECTFRSVKGDSFSTRIDGTDDYSGVEYTLDISMDF
jgi:hypothetical protein